MPQSLSRIIVHAVFSTLDRRDFLDESLAPRTHAYLGGALNQEGCQVIAVGGVSDHVHLLFALNRTKSISELISKLKSGTTKWVKAEFRGQNAFAWQAGYGAFSVGMSEIDRVANYVRNQEAHHRKMSFQEEFRVICTEFGVEIDERYVWE